VVALKEQWPLPPFGSAAADFVGQGLSDEGAARGIELFLVSNPLSVVLNSGITKIAFPKTSEPTSTMNRNIFYIIGVIVVIIVVLKVLGLF